MRRSVNLLDVTNAGLPSYRQHVMGSRTDDAGFVEFTVRESRRYVIEHAGERSDQKMPRTAVFTVDPPNPSLVLVLPNR